MRTTQPHPTILWLATIVAAPLLGQDAAAPAQDATATPAVASATVISPSTFDAYTKRFLDAHGDRFYKAGMERVTMTGVLTIGGVDSSISIVRELPGKGRVTQTGASAKTLTLDGAKTGDSAGTPAARDQDLLDTLVADREDYFFYSLLNGYASRALGSRFRTDDGTNPNYSGPYYDIYELIGPEKILGIPVHYRKYAFDTTTGLLSLVMYTLDRQGQKVNVTTILDNWKSASGQLFPGSIVRTENGSTVFSLRMDAAAIGPATNDGSFTTP